ncbi:sigma-70 family RNA polymerase sigma factor [Streptomyces sp. NPDC045470]|uniref:RNA polymerase sigma factor n=1 Tax=Streptomyces sp. NPDC045470 TaxID=3155469 RepID=UPI0033F622D0
MDEYQSPDCLGCSDESHRQAVVFPNDPIGDTRTESPTGLYTERSWWCQPCWVYRDPLERFHLLYGRRLRNYTCRKLSYLPSSQREAAVDEVMAEAMEALWRQRETLKTPERAMYAMAKRMARRRFPLDPKEIPTDLLETEEDAQDPIDALVDRILLEEELDKLPEKTRQYLYDHKALGETAESVAADYGVSKGTVTQSARRGLDTMRPAFDYLRFLAVLLELIRQLIID